MKLLLHICCGPCALYPVKELLSKKFESITGFFYNPNIHPPSEYKRRKDTLQNLAAKSGFNVIYPPYNMEEYFRAVFLKEGRGQACLSPTERCSLCWELRLTKTAEFAKEHNFDTFTTTLLISPYQNHELIKKIGGRISSERGVAFYYEDFRPGFREGQEEAKTQDLYRQKYCGCVFSELERVNV